MCSINTNDINPEEHFGLVGYVINKYFSRNITIKGYEYDDLFQEGCIALVKASKTFDSTKGAQFSTYATRFIYCDLLKFFRADRWYIGSNEDRMTGNAETPVSFSAKIKDAKDITLEDRLEDKDFTHDLINELCVKQLLSTLEPFEREVLENLFFQNKSQDELAEKYGVNQVKISRTKRKALLNLRRVCDAV